MTKYTIEIHHVEGNWFEPTTTLHNLSYKELLELYAFTKAYKFPLKDIFVKANIDSKSRICVEEFIVQESINLNLLIKDINI